MLRQSGVSRKARHIQHPWLRRSGAHLPGQRPLANRHRRGGPAGGIGATAELLQSGPLSGTGTRAARSGFKPDAAQPGQPQVALIALDPHTGEIKALVGGRNYSTSQLNHVIALRQPGSVFKPFVYTAAIASAVEGGSRRFTPASTLIDDETTFHF